MNEFFDWLEGLGLPLSQYPLLERGLAFLVVAFLAVLVYLLVHRVVLRGIRMVAKRTEAHWDDLVVESRILARLTWLAPILVFGWFLPLLFPPDEDPVLHLYASRLLSVWLAWVVVRTVSAFLDLLVLLGQRHPATRDKPLRSYAQVVMLVVWLLAGIYVVATLMGKSPWALMTGLGALTAVLLLVFKDSILGFVASIEIAANDLVRVGDWIEMPSQNADGEVVDISLHTVKVQNWDKTITPIPTYQLVSSSFKNWRGMQDSGARRIKRALYLDQASVRFLTDEDLERLKRVQYIQDYLDRKVAEIQRWNQERKVDESTLVNGRHLTNLGTFRAYMEAYLRNHPALRQDMTLMVRQLPPGPNGIPLEVYAFSGEQRWVPYEGIQADLFDHFLAALPEFGLRVFQEPTGHDLRACGRPEAPSAS